MRTLRSTLMPLNKEKTVAFIIINVVSTGFVQRNG